MPGLDCYIAQLHNQRFAHTILEERIEQLLNALIRKLDLVIVFVGGEAIRLFLFLLFLLFFILVRVFVVPRFGLGAATAATTTAAASAEDAFFDLHVRYWRWVVGYGWDGGSLTLYNDHFNFHTIAWLP